MITLTKISVTFFKYRASSVWEIKFSSLLIKVSMRAVSLFQAFFFYFTLLLVNGHWSAWGSFGPCSRSCGSGKQYRRRACNNPAPSSGGRTCNGPSHQSKACNIHVCEGRYHSSIKLLDGMNICFCWSGEMTSKSKWLINVDFLF